MNKHQHLQGIKVLNILNEISINRWASENSYLYSFVLYSTWRLAKNQLKSRARVELQTEYAIPTEKIDNYKSKLAGKLLELMYNFCKASNIQLVILDIPYRSKDEPIVNSAPDELLDKMKSNCNKFVHSTKVHHE